MGTIISTTYVRQRAGRRPSQVPEVSDEEEPFVFHYSKLCILRYVSALSVTFQVSWVRESVSINFDSDQSMDPILIFFTSENHEYCKRTVYGILGNLTSLEMTFIHFISPLAQSQSQEESRLDAGAQKWQDGLYWQSQYSFCLIFTTKDHFWFGSTRMASCHVVWPSSGQRKCNDTERIRTYQVCDDPSSDSFRSVQMTFVWRQLC